MQRLSTGIVGRESELDTVARFVRDVTSGPASLVLDGPAGIGKTAIWHEAVGAAQQDGLSVRTSRCTKSDAEWAFAGLGDLLDGLGAGATANLPEIQREALAGALGESDVPSSSLGDRVVALAVLGVLRGSAEAAPLLLAIDDVQWLDASSRKVLSFALRRLRDEPIRLLASCRTATASGATEEADLGLPGVRMIVGPASLGTLQRIVQSRLGQSLSRPTLTRLEQATGGNPMMFLEMARALQRHGREPAADEPLPVPADLRVLVNDRLRGLSSPTRQLLLVTAALTQPTDHGVAAALDDPESYLVARDEALAAGVLELDGPRLRFTHPLIASVPYEDLRPAARRQLHQRLALTVTDPEQRARHAALGADGESASVAAALDLAARHAHGRGSLSSAAELAELALRATPANAPYDVLHRSVAAAEYLFRLGDPARARAVLTRGLCGVPPGPDRVPGLLLQATIASLELGDATIAAMCEQALREAGDEPLLRARCHATFAETSPSGAVADFAHAQRALDLLQAMESAPRDLLSNVLTNVAVHGCRLGRGLAVSALEQAVALQSGTTALPVSDRPGMALGIYLKVADRFEESRTWLRTIRTCALDEGDDSALPMTLGHLALLECWAGNYAPALQYAIDGRGHATRIGYQGPMVASAHVLVLAHLGRLSEARALGELDLAADEALGYHSAVALHHRSLGITEIFAGNSPSGVAHLKAALAIAREIDIAEPAIMRLHPDAVAGLLDVGEVTTAELLTTELAESHAANGLPWSGAMAARCHGLLRASSGDLDAAIAAFERALLEHERLPMPFEEARTRLLLGITLRRAGMRSDARRELEAALTVFVRLGAPVQTAQARAELAGIGGRVGGDDALTAMELRLATLVGAGHTSREVAAALFISVRTVDSHLGRVYRKLGLRSRTELAVWIAAQPTRPGAAIDPQ